MTDLNLEDVIAGKSPVELVEPEPTPPVEAEPVEAAPEPEAEAAPEPQEREPDMVPVGVVAELRRELRELRKASQAAPEPPEPEFLDPEGAKWMRDELAKMQSNYSLELSEAKARITYGEDVVNEAFEAAQASDAISQFIGQPDAWGKLVKWHKAEKVAREIGGDPVAYRAKLEAELRAKIQAELVADQAKKVAAQTAPTLANITGTGGGPKVNGFTGPTPLEKILGS